MILKTILKLNAVCTIVLLGSVLVFAQSDDKNVQLRYDFKEGNRQNYSMSIDGSVVVEVSSRSGLPLPSNNAKMQGEFTYAHEVTAVNPKDKSANINVVYGKSYMNTIINNQVIPNPDIPLLDGKIAQVTVAANGEVKDFKLPSTLPLSLQNADFRKMFVVFPERILRPGESWFENRETTDDDNENFSTVNTINSKYTLLGVEKKGNYKCAKVKFESVSNSKTKSKNPDLIMDGNIDGKVEGIIYYNLDNGTVVHSDLSTKIENLLVSGKKGNEQDTQKVEQIKTVVNTDLHIITELL